MNNFTVLLKMYFTISVILFYYGAYVTYPNELWQIAIMFCSVFSYIHVGSFSLHHDRRFAFAIRLQAKSLPEDP